MNTVLTDIIPAKARKYLYAALALAGIVVGALNIAGVDTGAAVDVLAYLTIAFGAVAASNTDTLPAEPEFYDADVPQDEGLF